MQRMEGRTPLRARPLLLETVERLGRELLRPECLGITTLSVIPFGRYRYSLNMSEDLRFIPPGVEFDPRLANELARLEAAPPTVDGEAYPVVTDRRSPFKGYVRMLTPEGGILILYRDQNCFLFLTILRVLACIVVTGGGGWLIFVVCALSFGQTLGGLTLLALLDWLIIQYKIEARHTVEIRPDAMIIDGQDVFYAEDIGDNWPELQMKDDDPDRMVICGICGTRFIDYMTANRLDGKDRTPEVLAVGPARSYLRTGLLTLVESE